MKEHLPFQAQWTVKLLQWILSKKINLEELLTDEDVLAGVVSFFTKRVAVDASSEAGISLEDQKAMEALEQELDFVKTRLAGADLQRQNETKRLDERNAELRQQIVKLTHKVKEGEKEIFESKFSVGKMKAAIKRAEEEARDYKRTAEKRSEALQSMKRDYDSVNEELAVAKDRAEQAVQSTEKELERIRADFEMEKSEWERERQKLLYMLSERDNALSEAREGQAAATREIQTMQSTLDKNQNRLSLLEIEAVKQGIPMIKVGDEPVVGSSVAEAMRNNTLDKADTDPEDQMDETFEKRSRKKRYNKAPEPASSIELGDRVHVVDLTMDTRSGELSDIEITHPDYADTDTRFNAQTIEYVGTDFNVDTNTADPTLKEPALPQQGSHKANLTGASEPEDQEKASPTGKRQRAAKKGKSGHPGERTATKGAENTPIKPALTTKEEVKSPTSRGKTAKSATAKTVVKSATVKGTTAKGAGAKGARAKRTAAKTAAKSATAKGTTAKTAAKDTAAKATTTKGTTAKGTTAKGASSKGTTAKGTSGKRTSSKGAKAKRTGAAGRGAEKGGAKRAESGKQTSPLGEQKGD